MTETNPRISILHGACAEFSDSKGGFRIALNHGLTFKYRIFDIDCNAKLVID